METKQYIKTRLKCDTTASEVLTDVNNNRIQYMLLFEESVNTDDIKNTIRRLSADMTVSLSVSEIRPCKYRFSSFEIVVEEQSRREGVDNMQHALDSFES